MNSMLSLTGCAVIGGIFLLSLFGFQADLRDHAFSNTNDLIVQQNAIAMTELLESDFRQIGFGVDSLMVASAGANAISYFADLNDDGAVDLVAYSLSDAAAAAETSNPRDKILYRTVNGAVQVNAALGVTDFRLKYFDLNGNVTNNLSQIKIIEMTLEMESTTSYDGKYAHFFWRKKITPVNLLRS
ncbi:MAG: hypothetical protein AAB354_01545 [candidate division KSB1 bacterium]